MHEAILTYTRQTFLSLNKSQYEGMNLKCASNVKAVSKLLSKVGLSSTESEETAWGFVIRGSGKALTVYAESESEMRKWMTAIGRCLVHDMNSSNTRPLKTGWLVKFFPGDMEKKLRFVELRKGSLKYYEDSCDEAPKVAFELIDCRCGSVPDVSLTFFIASKELNSVWHFTAESESEKVEWLKMLKENIIVSGVSQPTNTFFRMNRH